MRKIETGKLAKVFERGSVISACSGLLVSKLTNVDHLSVHANSRHPSRAVFKNPFVSRCVVRLLSAISSVLRNGTPAKVCSPIIERILVAVVMQDSSFTHDDVVHKHCSISDHPDSIVRARVNVPDGVPVPVHQELVVNRVNNRVLVLRERDETDRLVERLNDSVTLHVELHKEPAFLVRQFSRFSIVAQEAA